MLVHVWTLWHWGGNYGGKSRARGPALSGWQRQRRPVNAGAGACADVVTMQWRRCGSWTRHISHVYTAPVPNAGCSTAVVAALKTPTLLLLCLAHTPAVCVDAQETLRTALAMGADRAIHVQVRLESRRCTAVCAAVTMCFTVCGAVTSCHGVSCGDAFVMCWCVTLCHTVCWFDSLLCCVLVVDVLSCHVLVCGALPCRVCRLMRSRSCSRCLSRGCWQQLRQRSSRRCACWASRRSMTTATKRCVCVDRHS